MAQVDLDGNNTLDFQVGGKEGKKEGVYVLSNAVWHLGLGTACTCGGG